MRDLVISEKRKPQDGKIKFKKYGPLDIDLRVATIPSLGAVEDVVMRILVAGEPIPLDKLGLTVRNKERLQKTVFKPYGLLCVCGPTGSGKTTTLHSILMFLTHQTPKSAQLKTRSKLRKKVCGKDRSTRKPVSTLP